MADYRSPNKGERDKGPGKETQTKGIRAQMSTELPRNKERSSSSGTEGLPTKVAVDEGPRVQTMKPRGYGHPYSPSLLPESKQPRKPLPKKLLLLSDELGADRVQAFRTYQA